MKHSNDCIDACLACVIACEKCISRCLTTGNLECLEICRDCADICSMCARMEARGSLFTEEFCALCAKVSMNCSDECNQHAVNDDVCKECAEACSKCSAICSTRSKTPSTQQVEPVFTH